MRLTTTITILALFILVFAACGQTGIDKRTSLLESIQKKSTRTLGKSQDTAFLRKAAEVYGDSILIQMDNFLTDTTLIKKLDTTYEKDKVKGVLSKYKIEDPESMVGPISDFGNVFSNSELKYLDSILYKHFEKTATLVSIVTLDSSILKGKDFRAQLTIIQEGWDICNFKKNGLIIGIILRPLKINILRCPNTSGDLSAEKCDRIANELMIPLFRQIKYFEGLEKGLSEILRHID